MQSTVDRQLSLRVTNETARSSVFPRSRAGSPLWPEESCAVFLVAAGGCCCTANAWPQPEA